MTHNSIYTPLTASLRIFLTRVRHKHPLNTPPLSLQRFITCSYKKLEDKKLSILMCKVYVSVTPNGRRFPLASPFLLSGSNQLQTK